MESILFRLRSVSFMSDETTQPFSWQAHPARERRAHSVMAFGFILIFSALIFASVGNPAWGAASLVILVLGLNRFFFPSRYVIDDEGITAKYPLRRLHYRWTELRRFVHDQYGGYLSTRSRPSRLDAYKGMHIQFGGRRDDIIECINRHMAEAGKALQAIKDSELRSDPHPGLAIEALSEAFRYAVRSQPPSPTSGLVEFQRLMSQLGPRKS